VFDHMSDLPPEHVIAQALTHPLRARALAILGERTASPKELAQDLSTPLPLISNHVRMLAELGVIRLERTTPIRGAVEHHYRATVRARVVAEPLDPSGS
jgi:DNA-binding transcriptional ArsR family regulator